MPRKKSSPGLPSRQQILDFIAASDEPAGKREIARAFGLKGNEKIALKALLRDMADEGLIDRAPGPRLPQDGRGAQGDGAARRRRRRQRPRLGGARALGGGRAAAAAPGDGAQGPGRRRSASATASWRAPRRARSGWIAHPMKKLLKGSELVLGVVHQEGDALLAAAGREEGAARAADLRARRGAGRATSSSPRRSGRPPRLAARVDTILGDPFAPRSFSLIAIHKHGIPHEFPRRA